MRNAQTNEGAPKPQGRLRSFAKRLKSRAAAFSHDYIRDEDGNILIMTAFLSIPLVMGVAVAIDTAELYRAQQNFQQAADAAVLVAANMYSDGASEEDARTAGERIFADNLGNLPDSRGTPVFDFPADCGEGDITIDVVGNHPLFFPGIHGIGQGDNAQRDAIRIDAAASCPTTTFEVALVVDTSGSMSRTIRGDTDPRPKIEIMQEAASGLVTDLFALKDAIPREDPVRFAVVPFSGMVAVDYTNGQADSGSDKERWNRNWEDRQGRSPIHHQDFDWASDLGREPVVNRDRWWSREEGRWLTRYSLYEDLGVRWAGCMQARPYPHSVQDTVPANGTPASLFVPSFAPDEPDWIRNTRTVEDDPNTRPYCTEWRSRRDNSVRRCRQWSDGLRGQRNNRAFPVRPSFNDGTYYVNGEYQVRSVRDAGYDVPNELYFGNNYIADGTGMPTRHECRGYVNHEACSGQRDQPKRQAFTFKYKNPVWHNSSRVGPNASCTSTPLMPLNDSETDVNRYIRNLRASGITNIPAGAMWGWRTLSSNLPFAGREETQRDNLKIMVIMSDGQNYLPTPKERYDRSVRHLVSDYNRSEYSGYGYGRHDDGVNSDTNADGFLFDGFNRYPNPGHNMDTYTQAMDDRLSEICENAKRENIIVYSIAFDVPNGSSIKRVLEGCASDNKFGEGKNYFDASNSAKLTEAFQEIADSLKQLRLTK